MLYPISLHISMRIGSHILPESVTAEDTGRQSSRRAATDASEEAAAAETPKGRVADDNIVVALAGRRRLQGVSSSW